MFVDRMVAGIFRAVAALPLGLVYVFSGMLGAFVYAVSPTYRRLLTQNLKQALGHDLAWALKWAAIRHGGRQGLESIWIFLRPLDDVLEKVRSVQGTECVEQALNAGKGILFLTPHLGCFEITGPWVASRYGAMIALYKKPKHGVLDQLIRAGRVRGNMDLAPADVSGVRQVVKKLRQRQMATILPDQVPGAGDGVWAEFFNRPAWTMTLAARLSELANVEVLTIVGERLAWGQGWRLHIAPMSEALTGDTAARAQIINREMERLIRRFPAQYLWSYNRYKKPAGIAPPPAAPQ